MDESSQDLLRAAGGASTDPDTIILRGCAARSRDRTDYRSEAWGIVADARVPEQLLEAGLEKPNCRAVVALTKNERINLKISVTTHLLNPSVTVVTKSTAEVYEDTLATLGDEVHIADRSRLSPNISVRP